MYKEKNINPINKKTSDCVIRAIAFSEKKSWMDVFDSLVNIAREKFTIPNEKDTYNIYLQKYNTINVMHLNDSGKKKRYTVKDVCGWNGIYIVQIANHLTCVIDGICYDTWDCSSKSSYKIWKVESNRGQNPKKGLDHHF